MKRSAESQFHFNIYVYPITPRWLMLRFYGEYAKFWRQECVGVRVQGSCFFPLVCDVRQSASSNANICDVVEHRTLIARKSAGFIRDTSAAKYTTLWSISLDVYRYISGASSSFFPALVFYLRENAEGIYIDESIIPEGCRGSDVTLTFNLWILLVNSNGGSIPHATLELCEGHRLINERCVVSGIDVQWRFDFYNEI